MKYLNLNLNLLQAPCTAASNLNTFYYNDFYGSDISTIGQLKVAFTIWFKVDTADGNNHNILKFSKSAIEVDRCNTFLTVDIIGNNN